MLIEISSHSTAEREKAGRNFRFLGKFVGRRRFNRSPTLDPNWKTQTTDSLFCSVREVHHLESIKRQNIYIFYIDLRILFIEFSY